MVVVSVVLILVMVVLLIWFMILWWLVGLCIVCVGCVVNLFVISGVVCYWCWVMEMNSLFSCCRCDLLERLIFEEFLCFWLYSCCGKVMVGCGMLFWVCMVLMGLVIRWLSGMVLLMIWLMKEELVLFFSRWCIR